MLNPNWTHNQNLNPEEVLELFSPHVSELLHLILDEGFILTLVGGSVRDYFINGAFSKDLDFEISIPESIPEPKWIERIKALGHYLSTKDQYHIESLSFSIMRISWVNEEAHEDFELAPARIETFPTASTIGHSDMEVSLLSRATYKETFARRDFTLNALGIEFLKKDNELIIKFIDPFNGLVDLHNKTLNSCSENFSKDPVRFCRAIRFALKFDLEFSNELIKQFGLFNLLKLTAFYFFKEALKVEFFLFCETFFRWVDKSDIELNADILALSFLTKIKDTKLKFKSALDILFYLLYQDEHILDISELEHFAKMGKLKVSLVNTHLNFRKVLLEMTELDFDSILSEVKEMSFEEYLKFEHRDVIKSFHHYYWKKGGSDCLHHLETMNSRLAKGIRKYSGTLPQELLGKSLAQEMIQSNKIPTAYRKEAPYYCHLKSLASALYS